MFLFFCSGTELLVHLRKRFTSRNGLQHLKQVLRVGTFETATFHGARAPSQEGSTKMCSSPSPPPPFTPSYSARFSSRCHDKYVASLSFASDILHRSTRIACIHVHAFIFTIFIYISYHGDCDKESRQSRRRMAYGEVNASLIKKMYRPVLVKQHWQYRNSWICRLSCFTCTCSSRWFTPFFFYIALTNG